MASDKESVQAALRDRVVLVAYNDWNTLYVDGQRKIEGHSLSAEQVLEALGIDYGSIYIDDSKYADDAFWDTPYTLAELYEIAND